MHSSSFLARTINRTIIRVRILMQIGPGIPWDATKKKVT